ncbi:hypothetical protein BDZ88DRAFT_428292 [Geranomyces variabilis]|nr:hypothetical protein BDZ88DRAFT_428292 [Geranomyces variabilis]
MSCVVVSLNRAVYWRISWEGRHGGFLTVLRAVCAATAVHSTRASSPPISADTSDDSDSEERNGLVLQLYAKGAGLCSQKKKDWRCKRVHHSFASGAERLKSRSEGRREMKMPRCGKKCDSKIGRYGDASHGRNNSPTSLTLLNNTFPLSKMKFLLAISAAGSRDHYRCRKCHIRGESLRLS